MRSLTSASTLALAFALAAVGSTAVRAADMPEYPPIIEAPEPLPLPAAGGWYLRGDIGYKIYNEPEMSYHNGSAGYTGSAGEYKGEFLDETFMVGVGAGYKFNDYLRLDATIDYELKADGGGNLNCIQACGDPGHSSESYTLDAGTGLINAYVDLGTYGGFTPYVGGGVGVSYLTTSDVKFKNPDGTTGSYDGDSTWNFAWALMAGASYALTDNLLLDVNYRYLNLGDAQTGDVFAGTSKAPIKIEDIDAHEVRVGVRYNLF